LGPSAIMRSGGGADSADSLTKARDMSVTLHGSLERVPA
jgi:hypothetical protein